MGVRTEDEVGVRSRRVMETPPTSTDRGWKLAAEGRMSDERSTSMPCCIWCLMEEETKGELRAMADGGMGAGVAVEREKEEGGRGLDDTG